MTAYLFGIVGLAIFISLKAEADRHRSAVRREKLQRVGAKLAGVLAVPPMLTFGVATASYAEWAEQVARQMWSTLLPVAEQITRGMIAWWQAIPESLRDDMAAQYQADRMRQMQADNRPMYDAYMWATTGRHDPPAPSGPFDEVQPGHDLYVDAEIVDAHDLYVAPVGEANWYADLRDRFADGPPDDETARCYYCGGTYPAPVSLHHSREECDGNLDLTVREGYQGMPLPEGCWADVWSDRANDYQACGADPEGDLGLCTRHADDLKRTRQETS